MPSQPARDLTAFVEFDWEAYYEQFDQFHGGDPVVYGEVRLLYRDGWMYALGYNNGYDRQANYAGPEWEPEDEESKRKLQIEYWRARRDLVLEEAGYLKIRHRSLGNFQAAKCLPLKIYTYTRDEDTQQRVRRTIDLDLDAIQARIDWLADDLKECERELKILEKFEVATEQFEIGPR